MFCDCLGCFVKHHFLIKNCRGYFGKISGYFLIHHTGHSSYYLKIDGFQQGQKIVASRLYLSEQALRLGD